MFFPLNLFIALSKDHPIFGQNLQLDLRFDSYGAG